MSIMVAEGKMVQEAGGAALHVCKYRCGGAACPEQ